MHIVPYYCPGACNQLVGRGHGTIGLKLLGATALVIAGVWPSRASAQASERTRAKIIFDTVSRIWDKMI